MEKELLGTIAIALAALILRNIGSRGEVEEHLGTQRSVRWT